ncbi:MAG: hypothetical protein PHR47_02750 [Candidatus Pacebacteria bacterium]|nr:hypothetical protein [Candidatus Paceibacterota bacterium]
MNIEPQSWVSAIVMAFQRLFESTVNFIPDLLAAIIVFILGYLLSMWLGMIIAAIFRTFKFDNIFRKTGWDRALAQAEIETKPSDFMGGIFKWIFIVMFLTISTEIIGWTSFTELLNSIIMWVPNLIVAIGIMVVAIIIADILEKIAKASIGKMGVSSINFLGSLIKWSIYIFAIFAVLIQLGVAVSIVNTLVIGLITTITLALGLSFGLGGKEIAGDIVRDLKNKLSKK